MSTPRFSSLFLRLSRDPEARKAFIKNPAEFIRGEGIDPELLDLPREIDAATLEAKIDAAFGDGDANWTADAEEAAKLNAEDLWSRFGVIAERARPGRGADVSVVTSATSSSSVAAAVVVYGTSVVTSEGASVAFERARFLRGVARLRKSDLTFTITRPDGTAVDNLPANAVETLLRRMR